MVLWRVDYYNWEWWYKELWKVFSTTDRSLTWSSHYRAELKDSYRNILGHVRTVFFTRYAYNWPASTNHFFSGSFIITAHYCGSVLSWIEVLGTLLRLSMPAVFIWRHTEGFSFWFQPMLYTCQCTEAAWLEGMSPNTRGFGFWWPTNTCTQLLCGQY